MKKLGHFSQMLLAMLLTILTTALFGMNCHSVPANTEQTETTAVKQNYESDISVLDEHVTVENNQYRYNFSELTQIPSQEKNEAESQINQVNKWILEKHLAIAAGATGIGAGYAVLSGVGAAGSGTYAGLLSTMASRINTFNLQHSHSKVGVNVYLALTSNCFTFKD